MIQKCSLIGGGVMAEAVLAGILKRGLLQANQITVGEPLPARRQELASRYAVAVTDDNAAAVQGAELVILAVKPQQASNALSQLDGAVDSQALVVSIVAGLELHTLARDLPSAAIVRVMPNTPARVGEGMSVWVATPETTSEQLALVGDLLSALGDQVQVHDEKLINVATALSGSGPAYVFLFIEALADAGVELGLNRALAERLAWQTLRGAAIYGMSSGEHPALLRNQVTSPGGTTAAALAALEAGGWRSALREAIQACYTRACQLGETEKP
ncbi:MAG: pyrroline-5-carboxylate reductase [Chloroflexi bacterium]|nr:pyrroline-5-carboxylate reductase [Chloroflexota bacterium]